jgi:hypothetical protein
MAITSGICGGGHEGDEVSHGQSVVRDLKKVIDP